MKDVFPWDEREGVDCPSVLSNEGDLAIVFGYESRVRNDLVTIAYFDRVFLI